MPLHSPASAALEAKKISWGFWLTFPSAAVARTILRPASTLAHGGFNWVLIDAEHGNISDANYYELTTAIASEGASPFIRVPWGEEWMIKRALDAGAHGIVTPMCHSASDAEKIVKYSKYPPQGTRGFGPLFTIHSFPGTKSGDEYVPAAGKTLKVVVQIESKQGLENVDEIARVPGVDVLFIGPFDLAMQTGMERAGKEHEAAMQRILEAAHAAGKKAAIFCTSGEDANVRLKQGFDMISVHTDVGVLASAMINELNTAVGSKADGSSGGGGYS